MHNDGHKRSKEARIMTQPLEEKSIILGSSVAVQERSSMSFLADEAAICAYVVEREYKGLRMQTPDVEFKAQLLF